MQESSKSSREMSRFDLTVLLFGVLIGAGIFLGASAIVYRIGFPLDDSWIHLTYARNLALHGQWAFRLGHPSAGSTSPLWSSLLAIGFRLGLAPYTWTYFLGGLSLLGLAVVCERTVRILISLYRPRFPWIGLLFVFEWHFLWAAMSGMETILHALLLTGVVSLLLVGSRRYLLLGLLTGISVWVRPDGLTLALPVLLYILPTENTTRARFAAIVRYTIGLGSLLVPFLLFNLWLSGTPMPNTFYAKQMEYAAWQARPLPERVGVMLLQVFTGPSILLLPGALLWIVAALRQKKWTVLTVPAWVAGYLFLYISRLPAYQHGRYLIPAMPALFLLGTLGYMEFRTRASSGRLWALERVWASSLVLVTAGFVFLGARAYAQDVGLIESEMVVTARWIAGNLPASAVLAAHDIGALGYFDDHELIDLAGLVSPEVIPFIRDERRLSEYLSERGADYLVAFPSFYPELTRFARPVFASNGQFAPLAGEMNMTVYLWSSR